MPRNSRSGSLQKFSCFLLTDKLNETCCIKTLCNSYMNKIFVGLFYLVKLLTQFHCSHIHHWHCIQVKIANCRQYIIYVLFLVHNDGRLGCQEIWGIWNFGMTSKYDFSSGFNKIKAMEYKKTSLYRSSRDHH